MRARNPILIVALLFVALVALNFIFFVDKRDNEENEITGDRSSYRSTPYGTLAFYTLLKENGYPVTRLQSPFTELAKSGQPGTLVLISLPNSNNPNTDEFKSLNEWVENGGLLIIIDRKIDVSLGDVNIRTESGNLKSGVRPLQPTIYTRDVGQVALSDYATSIRLESRTATYHLGNGQAAALADAKIGKGRVVLLTDPYVVANNGISKADNVILGLNLFADRPSGDISFDEYHHGYGSSTSDGMMSYFRGTPVPWMMWQAALIVAIIVYSYGRRFARPLPLRRERRTTNLEFVSSMANITRLARASDVAMQNIYSEFRNRLCRFSGVPARSDTATLARVAAGRAKIDRNELWRLLLRCEAVARGAPVGDSEMLALVTRIREIESTLGF